MAKARTQHQRVPIKVQIYSKISLANIFVKHERLRTSPYINYRQNCIKQTPSLKHTVS